MTKMHEMVYAVSAGMQQGHHLASLQALKALQPLRLLLAPQLLAQLARLLSLLLLLHLPMASHPCRLHPMPASPPTLSPMRVPDQARVRHPFSRCVPMSCRSFYIVQNLCPCSSCEIVADPTTSAFSNV